MKLHRTIPFILMLAAAFDMAQAKTKEPYKVPAVFNMAQFVWVEAVDGQQYDPRLFPEDRQAIGDVYKVLSNWHRYVIVAQRSQADLIFVVRKGRIATADVGVHGGNGPVAFPGGRAGAPAGSAGGPGNGPVGGAAVSVGGEVGTPDDLLQAYEITPNNPEGTLIWQRTLAHGLDSPDIPLFKQLKDEIDREYPMQSASKAPKP